MAKYITIMGIDPGINNCGISILRYYPDTAETRVYTYLTLHCNAQAKKEDKVKSKVYGSIFSLFILEREIEKLIELYQPMYIASEDAFYNPRTPNAFISLKGCINSIKRVLYKYEKTLFLIAPKLAKAAVCTGTANKEIIQETINRLPDLKIKNTKEMPLMNMVEHEADSIAIGYAFIKTILPELV
jgi:Holliday junction resolvasome RuvABC endonuclease subunit